MKTIMTFAHQLEIAIDWLECNEGADGEADACKAVATVLRKQLRNEQRKMVCAYLEKQGIAHNPTRRFLVDRIINRATADLAIIMDVVMDQETDV